ncbi:unnamed protein product [Miscanthus lutarioriparius]|uniref:Uncharacterized protein n=1 Tax=Miscanthus lutarioriparius TaxID=422564 RepID=A0A811SGR7_9POAL|nr:unnamed protein product [Miscanthus lutarioriparius]
MEEEKTVQSVQSHQWRLMPLKSCFLSMEEKARGNDTTPNSEATTMEGYMTQAKKVIRKIIVENTTRLKRVHDSSLY